MKNYRVDMDRISAHMGCIILRRRGQGGALAEIKRFSHRREQRAEFWGGVLYGGTVRYKQITMNCVY